MGISTNLILQSEMKLTIFALLAGSAAAFAPAPNAARTSVATSAATFEGELGVQPPLGLWDPLGCLEGIDQDTFDRYRYAEIKHGRVAQLAFVGHLVTALGIRLPGYISIQENIKFEDIPPGLGALAAVPTKGLWQIFLLPDILSLQFGNKTKTLFLLTSRLLEFQSIGYKTTVMNVNCNFVQLN